MSIRLPQITRVAAFSIITRSDEILLVRVGPRDRAVGQWTLPGGGLDFGESPANAAVREAREETGFDVTLGGVLDIFSDAFESADGSHHNIGIIYSAKVVGGELTSEVDGSTDLCEWIPLSQVDRLPLVALARFGAHLALTISSRQVSPSTPDTPRR